MRESLVVLRLALKLKVNNKQEHILVSMSPCVPYFHAYNDMRNMQDENLMALDIILVSFVEELEV